MDASSMRGGGMCSVFQNGTRPGADGCVILARNKTNDMMLDWTLAPLHGNAYETSKAQTFASQNGRVIWGGHGCHECEREDEALHVPQGTHFRGRKELHPRIFAANGTYTEGTASSKYVTVEDGLLQGESESKRKSTLRETQYGEHNFDPRILCYENTPNHVPPDDGNWIWGGAPTRSKMLPHRPPIRRW
jgi:hypothetical protein